MDHLSHFTDPITAIFRGPILILVLVVNGLMYGTNNGVELFAGGMLSPATVQNVEAITQGLSLMVILGTIMWHAYDYFVDTETDVRQEQIDEALQLITENQAKGTDVEITDEGKMRILYRLKDLDVENLSVEEIKHIIEQVQQNSRQSDGTPDS
jgi:hypothetical protein